MTIEVKFLNYHGGREDFTRAVHTEGKKRSLFVPLPRSQQNAIQWGCDCKFCKTHPNLIPHWDTVGIDLDNPEVCWVVHYPEVGQQ